MEQEKANKPEPLLASATWHGGLVGSLAATASLRPVPKPPWQRFMDLNVGLAKLLKLEEAAWEVGKQAAWEIGKGILGLKRTPAEA